MKMKNKWDGMSIIIAGSLLQKLVPDTANLEGNLEDITIQVGGIEFDVDMTTEECIASISVYRALCQAMRDEILEFKKFFEAIDGEKTTMTTSGEPIIMPLSDVVPKDPVAPVDPDVESKIMDALAKVKAQFGLK